MSDQAFVQAVEYQEQFPILDGVVDTLPDNVRQFTGNGKSYLPLPGCVEVLSVRQGLTVIPEWYIEEVLADPSGNTKKLNRHKLWKLDHLVDGTPVLLRGLKSNDGIWQEGAPVYVGGTFTDAPPPVPAMTPVVVVDAETAAQQQETAAAEAAKGKG